MSEFYEQVKERFIRYVKVDTQSQAGSSTAPSTMKQKNLGRMLRDELISLGVTDAELTEEGLCVHPVYDAGWNRLVYWLCSPHGYFSGCRRHRCKAMGF